MKAVTAEMMQELDRRAIEVHGIPGLLLMEHAGLGCVNVTLSRYGDRRSALIVCGKGNNGGDGYVIARHLIQKGWQVKVVVLCERDKVSGDAAENLLRLNSSFVQYCPYEEDLSVDDFNNSGLIIDAIFGTGLKKEPKGVLAKAIELINSAGAPVLSVDIPSGVDGSTGRVYGAAVKADVTVTFAFIKMGHLLYPGADFAGEIHVVDIGIPPEVTSDAKVYEFVDFQAASGLLKKRKRDAHKGNFGHLLVVAGSIGKTGAAAMAANSAVRAGSGLVSLAVPASLNYILEIKTTEAMTCPIPDANKGFFSAESAVDLEELLRGKDALALGPGISWNAETAEMVRRLVKSASIPVVIDADGLNAISDNVAVLQEKKSNTLVITPHPGEMARLTGLSVSEVENNRIGTASVFAERYSVYVILKGAQTVIASPDGEVSINGSGNPGMASGGMGDVLTGILASLLGQGYRPFDACKLGVYLHGLAADILASQKGEIGLSATDVQEAIPLAYNELLKLRFSAMAGQGVDG